MNRNLMIARRLTGARRYITLGGHKPNMTNLPDSSEDAQAASGTLMTSAPKWDEKDATESEADVKADREPMRGIQELKTESVDWFKKHENKADGSINYQSKHGSSVNSNANQ
ncbi:hypothetical protein O0I10_003256 [Lichtheimia ornata]|uniref:Uncharacterized protein n=1 Tax=Lichtheimia ornata TaxID=688661 RepID=A0AAD7V8K3_9FUNG|nr:uncharacterized protein O0I10_003256 [Lichtheimia ornata]KAJ8661034.1 hypothetical protein O0I10_003256 [Lichtheimia ornata]